MATRILISTNPENLAAAIAATRSVTVEAEWGDKCVSGSLLTLAHHGPRKDNPCPCLYEGSLPQPLDFIGGSHYDLDFLGGVLAVLGCKPVASYGFWRLAAFVDINGAHKLSDSGATPEDIRRLYAFWAWLETNRPWAPKDGTVIDVTENVWDGGTILERIFANDKELLARGDKFLADEMELNQLSFVEFRSGIVVRFADSFVNHLYVTPDGKVAKACVTFNRKTKGITISLADPLENVDCGQIAKQLFGEEAGGHATIAGSPRGKPMTLSAIECTVREMAVSMPYPK